MFKAIINNHPDIDFIKMGDMKPCQIGIIEDDETYHNQEVVMRTANSDVFEVMSISNPGDDACWDDPKISIMVRLLPKGTKIILEVI